MNIAQKPYKTHFLYLDQIHEKMAVILRNQHFVEDSDLKKILLGFWPLSLIIALVWEQKLYSSVFSASDPQSLLDPTSRFSI